MKISAKVCKYCKSLQNRDSKENLSHSIPVMIRTSTDYLLTSRGAANVLAQSANTQTISRTCTILVTFTKHEESSLGFIKLKGRVAQCIVHNSTRSVSSCFQNTEFRSLQAEEVVSERRPRGCSRTG